MDPKRIAAIRVMRLFWIYMPPSPEGSKQARKVSCRWKTLPHPRVSYIWWEEEKEGGGDWGADL